MKKAECEYGQKILANRFIVNKKIGSGSFGNLYLCFDKFSQQYVALKVEKEKSDQMLSLDRENQILETLKGIYGIPNIVYFGKDNNHNCLAQQLLSQDLSYYMRHFKKLTLKCVVNLANQLIRIIEQIHNKGVIHRDIKPENIMTGIETEAHQVFVIDFGVSKFFRATNGNHIPFREDKPFIGTTRYGSIAAHQGRELGRKDDLESLGYMFIYLLKGQLPWQGMKNICEIKKTEQVGQMKQNILIASLCKELPLEFQRYFEYVMKLGFKQQPDYKYLHQLFTRIHVQNKFKDTNFDWNEPGTITTTKTSDSNQQPKQILDQVCQDKLLRRDRSKNSRLSSGFGQKYKSDSQENSPNLGPQFISQMSPSNLDLLNIPQQRGRSGSRHQSAGNDNKSRDSACAKSQQSSIYMKYSPSNLSSFSPKKKSYVGQSFTPHQDESLALMSSNFQDLEKFTQSYPELELDDESDGQSIVAQFMEAPMQDKNLKSKLSKH